MPTFREFCFEFLGWLTVAVFCTVAGLTIWLWAKGSGHKLLPPRQFAAVPWTGLEIGTAFFLTKLLGPIVVSSCLIQLGFFTWLYGWEVPDRQGSIDKIAEAQIGLWVTILIFPLQLATVFCLFRFASGTQIHELGLSIRRPRENLALACLCWLAITPLVFGVHYLAYLAYFWLLGSKPVSHPLQQLAEGSPTLLDGILIGISALAVAPIWEELMFRRVLQSWLAQRDWGGHLGMGLAALIAVGTVVTSFNDSQTLTRELIVGKISPILFVLAIVPGYFYGDGLLRKWIPDRNTFRGIYATAMLFGMVHSFAWPTPIPLFVLGLGLGFLAYRTQTLFGPILLHSLFNAVACLALVFSHVLPDWPNGNDETSALTRSSPTAASTRVPGSWQLRCR